MSTPRRQFLQSLVAWPLLPLPQASPRPSPSPTPSSAELTPGPVAEALGAVVDHRYGSQLGPKDMEAIKKSIERNLRSAEGLRKKLTLANGDEPVATFRAAVPLKPLEKKGVPR